MARPVALSRGLLIAGLVLAMSLCCCRMETWVSRLLTGFGGPQARQIAGGSGPGLINNHAGSCCSSSKPSGPSDSEPAPKDDSHSCPCRQLGKLTDLTEAPQMALPGADGVGIALTTPLHAPRVVKTRVLSTASTAFHPPPRSLLRLHCALVV